MIDEKKKIEYLAQMYARSLVKYGVDISEKLETATSISMALNEAYLRGRSDSEKRQWIPVEEGLPEKRDWYLAVFQEPDTGFIGLPYIADYLLGSYTNYTTEDGWIIAHCTDRDDETANYYKKLKCIAWMPLPTPYEQKGSEENAR